MIKIMSIATPNHMINIKLHTLGEIFHENIDSLPYPMRGTLAGEFSVGHI